MALVRFPHSNYASIEINQAEFTMNGMTVGQTPLGEYFTDDKPCENGMWVLADKSKGSIGPAAAVTDAPIGIVYTEEKEYDSMSYGLKYWSHRTKDNYPRVGIFSLGDTITTNCLQYEDTEFSSETDLFTACDAYATTPLYVGLVAGDPVPKLSATKPQGGPVGVVTKSYTVPNGERGIKYQIISLTSDAAPVI